MRITGTAVVVSLSVFAAAAAVQAQDKLKATERSVTISGCVVAGDHDNTFMLSDVKPVSGWTPAANAPSAYWLNSTKGLKDRVGQRIEVRGVVDFDDTHEGQTKTTVDATETKDTKTKVSSEGKQVTMKQDTAGVAKVDEADKTKVTVPTAIYDLHVKSVKTIPGVCQAAKK